MLIKISNYCASGCSHCMEGSTKAGEHMTRETFEQALKFTREMEAPAWMLGAEPKILLSGGECTEHPQFFEFLERVVELKYVPYILTYGPWLKDAEFTKRLLGRRGPGWDKMYIQLTHDPRFYPHARPTYPPDPRIKFQGSLNLLLPLGRASKHVGAAELKGLPSRAAPSSFNLRSMARSLKSFQLAVGHLRIRAQSGMSGNCIPSVSHEGDVMAGETRNCWKLGTVWDSNEVLTKAIFDMKECDRCGLEAGLPPTHRAALGL